MAKADVAAGRAYVSLYVKYNEFQKALQRAKAEMQKFGSEMAALGTKIGAAGAAGLAPLAFGTKIFATFDDAMRMVKAVTQSTQDDFVMLSNKAKKLGATTSFTAVEVALLMTELGRAGFTAKQIDVMTASVMDMARATGTDAALSAGIMSASLRQFKLDATNATRVADIFTKTANSTFNTVESLGESMKYAGPVANELGLSLEETAAILGTLGNAGIQGSEAGTALRRLGVITAATGEKLKETFGISNVDASGNLKPIVQILDEIGKVVDKLPVEKKVAKMADAFGLLGITSASVLSGTSVETVKLADSLKNAAGTASKAAKEMDAGLGGSFRIILSAVEGLNIALGEALSESLQSITDAGTGVIGMVEKFVKENKQLVVTFAKIATVVTAGGLAILAIGLTFSGLAVVVGGFSAALAFAGTVINAVIGVAGLLFTKVGLVAIAIGGLTTAFFTLSAEGRRLMATLVSTVTTLFGDLNKTVNETFAAIISALKTGDIVLAGKIMMVGFKLVFQQGLDAVNSMFGDAMGKLVGQILSGDLVGAWGTAGSMILDTWAQITSGIVGMMTSTMNYVSDLATTVTDKIVSSLTSAVNKIADVWGSIVNTIANDMLAGTGQIERGMKLEEERRKLGLSPQNDGIVNEINNGTYQHPGITATRDGIKSAANETGELIKDLRAKSDEIIKGITSKIDEGRNAITDATSQAVADATGNQSKETSANIRRLQSELENLQIEAWQKLIDSKAVDDPKRKGEDSGSKSANSGMGSSSSAGPTSIATNNLRELQSAMMSPQVKQLKLAEEANKKTDKQIVIQEEVLASINKLGLYHA
jgi:TP901 family phage tail tape measure protein